MSHFSTATPVKDTLFVHPSSKYPMLWNVELCNSYCQSYSKYIAFKQAVASSLSFLFCKALNRLTLPRKLEGNYNL